MTRRKQSNPRSVKAVLGGQVEIVDPESVHSSQECDQAEETNEQDYEDFSPLVVDTSTASYAGVDSPPPSENGHHKLIDTSLPLSVTLPGSPPHTTVTATKPYVMPPEASASDAAGELAPQSLSLLSSSASSPPSPGPSTPSSLASSSGLVESAASKQQRRGKKIMPVAGTDGKARWQCPVCNEELSSDHDLTVHIRSHNTAQSQNPNTCTICNKVLSSQSSLDRHMLVHSGERPFQCKVCKMTFTTNGNMHRHSRIHAKGELKTVMSQAEPQQIGTKASRSSSLVTPKSSRSSNLTRADGSPVNKGSARSSWHKPQSYIHKDFSSSDNLLKNVTSGVDLHQALHGKLPQYQFLSSRPFTFVSQGHADTSGMPSLEHQDLKRIFLPEESSMPPSPKKRKYDNGTDLKSGTERSIKNQDALQADSARFASEGDTAVDLTMTEIAEEPDRKCNRLHSDDKTHNNPSRESASKANPQHHPHDQSLEEVHCPLCNKVLLSDFGLSSHLKAHHSTAEVNNALEESMEGDVHKAVEDSEGPSHSCGTCERAFSSSQKLIVHNRLTHGRRKLPSEFAVSLASSPVRPSQLNGLSKHLDAAVPGFYDLDFMDFTSEKFPLVAKVWCEKKPRRSSSVFHNFSCPECTCCFPNRGSLALHLASHKPDSWTSCPLCDCYFVSPDILHTHLSRHIADRAMSQALELRESDMCGKPGSMDKTDFMAMMDLASTKDLNQSHRNESIIESISKEQNNEYFYKLIGMGVKKSAEGKSSNLGHSVGEKDMTVFKLLSCTDYTRQNSPTSSAAVGEFPSKMQSPDLPPSTLSSEALMVSTPLFPGVGCSISAADSHPSSFPPVVPHGLQRVAGHGPFSLTPGCPNPYGSEEEDPLIDTKHNNVFACKYCGQAFSNYRALKGHTRVHLGLSPYKCNLCPYSSADKSTLIRHLRTHNGERPFQCLICDYAFTTKANCERHVRKKHEKVEKEEIEKAIAYNKYTTDLSTALENFHSPDTVCKYCGRDFKFFRALKHHLRSHSSCQQKPFMCTKCQVGFSMKANAIRHVQKQHEEVPQCDIEHYIHVNELAVISLEGNQTTEHDESVSSSSNVGAFTGPASSRKMGTGSTPPVAHSATPGPAEMLLSSGLLRNQHFTQPLDFSLKHASMAARLSKLLSAQTKMEQTGIKLEDDNQPIDLTTKKRTLSTSSCSSVASPASDVTSSATHVKKAVPTPTSSRKGSPCSLEPQQSSKIVCPLCQKTFSVKEEASSHLCDVHQIPSPAYSDSLLSSDGNNNKTTSPHFAHFLPVVMPTLPLSSVMHANAATASAGLTAHPAFGLVQQQKLAYRVPKSIHPSFMLPHLASIKKEPGTGSGSDSGCDLASVNKILDATDAHNFQAFLVPQATSSGSEDSDRHSANWESGDEESDRSLDQLYAQSLHSVTMKGDLVAEDGTDSKDGSLKKDEEASGGKNEIQDQLEDSDESGTDNSLTMMPEEKDHEQKSTNNSPSSADQLLVALSPKRAEEDSTPQKKKRNSYADSPHKLNCPHCPRSFPWVSSLKRHLLTHTGQKPFKCSRCPVTFSTKSNRERHLIRKHGVNMLDPASRQTMDRPYKCHLCVFSSFSTRSNLLKHYKERHPEHKPPEFYQDRLLDEDGFSETLSVKLNASSVDETSQSNTGSKAGSRAGELSPGTDGTSETAGAQTLQTPPKTKSVEAVIAALMRRETDSPGANYSASNFDENDEDSSDNTQTQSSDLPFSLSSSHGGSAERHVNPERDNYNVDKITHCWKCGDEFHSRKLLVRHLKEHNIDLPFKCYLCDASYDSRKECLSHQEKQHPSDWVVLKEKNGVDSVEEYADRLDLIVERNCKTGQFLEDGDDNETGTLGTGVEEGQAEVMASDYLQRKVYCSLCPKRFWSLQDLRRHMRSHTGERPFECDKCGKRFTLKHSMMRHRRKHGNHDSPSALSDDDDSIPGDSSAGPIHRVIRPQHPNVAHHPAAVLQSENSCVPAADSEEEKHSDDGEDMLHNLLGVESSTIDKIIDAKDSAASLLGV